MYFEDLGNIVLADTVGFIRDLPHELIKAFHATLEEAALADLILHVMDVQDPLKLEHKQQVEELTFRSRNYSVFASLDF